MFFNRLFLKLAYRSYCNQVFSVKEALSNDLINCNITVNGWVRSVRRHKNMIFVDIVDGSCSGRLQALLEEEDSKCFPPYASSIKVEGKLIESSHAGQKVELLADSWSIIASCDADYPFCNRIKYVPEYIREFLHLRPKLKTFSSMLRIRSSAAKHIHKFFQEKDFHFIHTPIITSNDCEGAGEVFSIQSDRKPQEREVKSGPNSGNESKETKNETDHFFGNPAYLTVSGQLQLEAIACAISKVYSFGPVFRAEKSRSKQHISEFYMIEAEMAFLDSIEELTKLVEESIKYLMQSLLNECLDDILLVTEKNSTHHLKYLENMAEKPFTSISYNEAINILQSKHLNTTISQGDDFALEHKNVLVKHFNNVPVFVTMFPSNMKPFYMKTDPHEMALCFDLLALYGGELCGGSLRENSEETLRTKLLEFGTSDTLSWYADIRKYGCPPHGGFGIGFERLLQCVLGITQIRDVIPFPRRINDCKC